MREAWDLTVYNWEKNERDLRFNNVQLGMREAWDLTAYKWV